MIKNIGDALLSREGKRFIIDEGNADVIRFLLLYFNDHRECEDVFPGMHHVLEKNLLIVGEAGTGKTMLMEIFSSYLFATKNRLYYRCSSMVRLMNYYKVHSHINKFTFNEDREFGKCEPFALCLNDIGLEVESQKSFGTDISDVVDEFLYARYEIYQQWYIRTHLTSNYDVEDFKQRFNYRINDRFKSYNLVPLTGNSRRG
ncbi:MAG: ATP-binding protein [Bacteroidaceae bacterium]|nr:ATP-binding protein [Bacteroidaceae bacterium]